MPSVFDADRGGAGVNRPEGGDAGPALRRQRGLPGPLKDRANAAAVLILCDITRRSPKRDCATPARGECQRLIVSHVNG
jgi:hypothetical protein